MYVDHASLVHLFYLSQDVYQPLKVPLARCHPHKVHLDKGRDRVLRRFQQHRSYRNKIETRDREEIPYSLRMVPSVFSVAEGP